MKKRVMQITFTAILLILPVQSVSSQIALAPEIKGTIRFHRSCYRFKYHSSSWTTWCPRSGFYDSPALWARKHKASWTEFWYSWWPAYYTSYQICRPVFEFDIRPLKCLMDERDFGSGQTFITYLYDGEQPDETAFDSIDVTAAFR